MSKKHIKNCKKKIFFLRNENFERWCSQYRLSGRVLWFINYSFLLSSLRLFYIFFWFDFFIIILYLNLYLSIELYFLKEAYSKLIFHFSLVLLVKLHSKVTSYKIFQYCNKITNRYNLISEFTHNALYFCVYEAPAIK